MKTTQLRLSQRPHGMPDDQTLTLLTEELPDPGEGELLLRVVYLSLDPYMRGWMDGAPLGETVIGSTVCEVVASRHPGFAEGDLVGSFSGWRTYALSDGTGLELLDPTAAPVSTAIGVLGVPGFTAYAGLLEVGDPQPGETVVVAAATGPVGSVVGQVANALGARSVGIAGGPEKCRALLEDYGFAAAVDRHSATFAEDLAAAVPDGVDVYFENVGGAVSRAVHGHLNHGVRIPVCGMVATYNDTADAPGPDRLDPFLQLVQHQSARLQGFLHLELRPRWDAGFRRDMPGWVADGTVRYREDVAEGLEQAPAAFRRMLSGDSFGKSLVRVGDDPTRPGS